LNANKTPPRAESNVEKEGGVRGGEGKGGEREREKERGGNEEVRRESGRKAGLDRSRD